MKIALSAAFAALVTIAALPISAQAASPSSIEQADDAVLENTKAKKARKSCQR
jgi:hypothetical protein